MASGGQIQGIQSPAVVTVLAKMRNFYSRPILADVESESWGSFGVYSDCSTHKYLFNLSLSVYLYFTRSEKIWHATQAAGGFNASLNCSGEDACFFLSLEIENMSANNSVCLEVHLGYFGCFVKSRSKNCSPF